MSQYFTVNAIVKVQAWDGKGRFSDRVLFHERMVRTYEYLSIAAKAELAGLLRQRLSETPITPAIQPDEDAYVCILASGETYFCPIDKKPIVLLHWFKAVRLGGKTAAHELSVHWRGQGTSSDGS